jgi:3-phosphoshikimate 1-carboxyvinyltransferase
MWRDICLANRTALLAELDRYRTQLDELRDALQRSDGASLETTFNVARTARREWAESKGRRMSADFIDLPQLLSARGTVRLPGSKSISNRVLLLAALAAGETEVRDLLLSDDTARMLDALRTLGVGVEPGPATAGASAGRRRFPVRASDLFLGNAGTAFRPLTAVLALAGGHYRLAGVPRMHERPIGDLVDALRQLGADISYLGSEGFPPLAIRPPALLPGRVVSLRGDVSSQFLTGLLMALPLLGVETTVEVVGELISKPYVEITLASMARFGVHVRATAGGALPCRRTAAIARQGWCMSRAMPRRRRTFWPSARLAAGRCASRGGSDSIQGDVRFADAFAGDGGASHVGSQLDRGLGAGRRNGGRLQGISSIAITSRTRP